MNITELRNRYRICGIAIFDLVLSILGTALVFLLFWKIHYPHLNWLNFVLAGVLLAVPIGIASHVIVGANTTLNYRLGLSDKPTSS